MRATAGWIVFAIALFATTLAVVSPQEGRRAVPPNKGPGESAVLAGSELELIHFLPTRYVTDGSVDYTAHVQRALDSARGRTLRLAPFPVLVSPPPRSNHCLVVRDSTHIVGGPACVLRTDVPAVQLLRIESTTGILLDGFSVQGVGGIGRNLAHGLIQVWNCENVELRGVRVSDADADAIAIANSSDVRVLGCSIDRGSKAGIYITACKSAVVDGNVVRDTVGHLAPPLKKVGAGILLLSNIDTVCSNNVVERGVGAGIVCGSNDQQREPEGVLITGNRVVGVQNAENPATSGGIVLANSQPNKRTHVVVASNSISACGQYAILVENHDGALVQGNAIRGSLASAIVVGHSRGVCVLDNVLTDINSELRNGQAGVYLHSHTSECLVRGTVMLDFERRGWPALIDRAPAGLNRVE